MFEKQEKRPKIHKKSFQCNSFGYRWQVHSIFVRHEVDDGSASSKSLNFITVSEPAMFLDVQYQDNCLKYQHVAKN